MLETKEKETKKTELQKPTGNAPIARTPFTFIRRFADDMERMFDDFDEFRLPKLFSKEFSAFSRPALSSRRSGKLERGSNRGRLAWVWHLGALSAWVGFPLSRLSCEVFCRSGSLPK